MEGVCGGVFGFKLEEFAALCLGSAPLAAQTEHICGHEEEVGIGGAAEEDPRRRQQDRRTSRTCPILQLTMARVASKLTVVHSRQARGAGPPHRIV